MKIGNAPFSPSFNPYQTLFTDSIENAGLEVIRIPPSKALPLYRATKYPIDLLHLDWHHDWYNGKNLGTKILKRLMYQIGLSAVEKLPLVWTAHDLFAHDSEDVEFDRKMTQVLINRCDGIMVMSTASEYELKRQYRITPQHKIIKFNHGHYIDCYANDISKRTARQKLGLPEKALVFGTFGTLKRYKGHRELILAFGEWNHPEHHLFIAGGCSDKSYRNELKSLVDDQPNSSQISLEFNFIADDDLQIYFNSSDVIALPFKQILNSGSLLLAMSFGKPVVASQIGSIPEIAFEDYYSGYDPNTQYGLLTALKSAADRFSNFEGQSGLIELTREKFDWNKAAKKLRKDYEELLFELR